MGKSGKTAKVDKLENQWTIDSNLEVVTQEGLDQPFYDFQRVFSERRRRFTHNKRGILGL